jgi:hypothetical protein
LIDERSSTYLYLVASQEDKRGLLLGGFDFPELSGIAKHIGEVYYCVDSQDAGIELPARVKEISLDHAKEFQWDIIIANLGLRTSWSRRMVAYLWEIFSRSHGRSTVILKIRERSGLLEFLHRLEAKRELWEVSIYLPLPASDTFKILLPVGKGQLGDVAIDLYNPSTTKQRVRQTILRFVVGLGLYQLLVKDRIVVATPRIGKHYFVQDIFSEHRVDTRGGIAVHNASVGSGTKAILAPISSEGELGLYVKVTNDEKRKELLQNEKRVLEQLQLLALQSGEVPKPPVQRAEGMYGASIYGGGADDLEQTGDMLTQGHVFFLSEIYNKTKSETGVDECEAVQTVCERIDEYFTPKGVRWQILRQGLDVAIRSMGPRVELGLAHKDFVSWNMKRRGKKLYVFDWEWAALMPPFYDVFHFIIHGRQHLRHARIGPLVRGLALEELERTHLRSYAELTCTDYSKRMSYLMFYLLERITFESYLAHSPRCDESQLDAIRVLHRNSL